MSSWIFRADPTIFDVDSYISDKKRIVWNVTNHETDIKAGDVVYIWRADTNGEAPGIIGRGITVSNPRWLPMDDTEYWRSALPTDDLRVEVSLDETFDTPLVTPARLKINPVLYDHPITTGSNRINYALTEEQAEQLAHICELQQAWTHALS